MTTAVANRITACVLFSCAFAVAWHSVVAGLPWPVIGWNVFALASWFFVARGLMGDATKVKAAPCERSDDTRCKPAWQRPKKTRN
ncbi:MAG TPA: hypothetical protein PK867_16515 [Pirellulales bacterium]|nr:hypothetical protein [Pirellulales bacterium]